MYNVCRHKIADDIVDEEKNRKRDKKRNMKIGGTYKKRVTQKRQNSISGCG